MDINVSKLADEGWEIFLKYPLKTPREIAIEVADKYGYNDWVVDNLAWVLKGWMDLD